MSRIAIIIPQYGKEEYTRKCVDLVKKNYGTGEPIEIVVVDDGSEIPFEDKTINVIRLDKNTGYTNATNEGILWAQYRNCDYVLLLNNDTEPHLGFLQELVLVLEANPDIGIAGSVRYHPTKEGQPYELCGSDIIRGYQYFTDKQSLSDIPIDCNWVPLCSGLIRMDMIREIGLLDKKFRNHCSDSEYCLRAKMNNWRVVFVCNSVVTHHLSVTTKANNIMVDQDQKLFLEKLAGIEVQKLMQAMPLDGESKTYGQLSFTVVKR